MDVKAGYSEGPGTKVSLSEQPDVDLAEASRTTLSFVVDEEFHAWGDSSSCQEESSPAQMAPVQHVPIPCTLGQQLQTEARFPSFPENAC